MLLLLLFSLGYCFSLGVTLWDITWRWIEAIWIGAFKINRLPFVWPLQFKIAHTNSTLSHSSSVLGALNITAVLKRSERNWKFCVCADELKIIFCLEETETEMGGRVKHKVASLHSQKKQNGWRLQSGSVVNQLFLSHRWQRQSCTGVPCSSPQAWVRLVGGQSLGIQPWLSPGLCGAGGIRASSQGALSWGLDWTRGAGLGFEGRALPCSLQLTRCAGGGSTVWVVQCTSRLGMLLWKGVVQLSWMNNAWWKQCKCCVAKLGFLSKCANIPFYFFFF